MREELRSAWVARMRTLMENVSGDKLLLWMSDRAPDEAGMDDPLARDPLFVTRPMLDQIGEYSESLVEVVGTREEIEAGRDRMVFSQLEEPVAHEMLGPVVHEAAARDLVSELLDRI